MNRLGTGTRFLPLALYGVYSREAAFGRSSILPAGDFLVYILYIVPLFYNTRAAASIIVLVP
jgi:hypothetical protein